MSNMSKTHFNSRRLFDDPGLLKQVLRDLGAHDSAGGGELHLQVLAEAAGVVIDGGAGIPKGLQQRVHLKDLLPQCAVVGLSQTYTETNKTYFYTRV